MTVPRTPDPPERVGEITAPQGKRIPLSVWAGLVVGALALRLANLGASPYGDEAYYFFVTRHLSAWWDTRTFPISGSVFPIFPLFFHWFAGSLSELRVANAVVGAMAVPLGMAVLRSVGVGRRLSVAGGAFLAIDLILVQFSALAFLDMLGAILALGAVLADVRGHRGAASTLVLLAALEKEFYALLGIALLVEHLISRRSIYWEMLIAAGVFWLWVAIRYLALHASIDYLLFGHAHAPFSLTGLNKALACLSLIPLIVAGGLYEPRLRGAAVYLCAYMTFLTLWGNAQGWYWCLPVMLAIILATSGAHHLLRDHLPHHRRQATIAVSLLLGIGLAFEGVETIGFVAGWRDDSATRLAQTLDRQRGDRQVDAIDCDWSYPYFPFGTQLQPAAALSGWSEVTAPIVVACPSAPKPGPGWTQLAANGGYRLFQRG